MSQAASEQSDVAQEDAALLAGMIETIERLFVGKREAVEHTVTALLAQGHVLFEDVPGVGKTTLARSMSYALGCQFQRVQFTSDLLPADIIGVSIFNRDTSSFDFKRGPVFTNLLLADEINRTTPRTQSALLEAMNEHGCMDVYYGCIMVGDTVTDMQAAARAGARRALVCTGHGEAMGAALAERNVELPCRISMRCDDPTMSFPDECFPMDVYASLGHCVDCVLAESSYQWSARAVYDSMTQ